MSQRINYDFKKIKTKLSLKIKIHSLHTNIVASIRMNKNYKKKNMKIKRKPLLTHTIYFLNQQQLLVAKKYRQRAKKKQ